MSTQRRCVICFEFLLDYYAMLSQTRFILKIIKEGWSNFFILDNPIVGLIGLGVTTLIIVRFFLFFVCLFVWRHHHYRWRVAKLFTYALHTIEKRGFFSVPHRLWHGSSVYNGHLRGLVKLIPVAECKKVKLSLPVFKTKFCHVWDSNT